MTPSSEVRKNSCQQRIDRKRKPFLLYTSHTRWTLTIIIQDIEPMCTISHWKEWANFFMISCNDNSFSIACALRFLSHSRKKINFHVTRLLRWWFLCETLPANPWKTPAENKTLEYTSLYFRGFWRVQSQPRSGRRLNKSHVKGKHEGIRRKYSSKTPEALYTFSKALYLNCTSCWTSEFIENSRFLPLNESNSSMMSIEPTMFNDIPLQCVCLLANQN